MRLRKAGKEPEMRNFMSKLQVLSREVTWAVDEPKGMNL